MADDTAPTPLVALRAAALVTTTISTYAHSLESVHHSPGQLGGDEGNELVVVMAAGSAPGVG